MELVRCSLLRGLRRLWRLVRNDHDWLEPLWLWFNLAMRGSASRSTSHVLSCESRLSALKHRMWRIGEKVETVERES